MKPFKCLSKKVLLDRSPFLVVEEHMVETPDGTVVPDWTYVLTPDFVIIIARNDQGEYLVTRGHRYAVEGITLAPPGGHIEPGEDPLHAGQRELLEETGFRAESWQMLGCFVTDCNRGNGKGWYYLATSIQKVCEPCLNDLEQPDISFISQSELLIGLREGQCKEVTSQLAYCMAILFNF